MAQGGFGFAQTPGPNSNLTYPCEHDTGILGKGTYAGRGQHNILVLVRRKVPVRVTADILAA